MDKRLIEAVKKNDTQAVQDLLKNGADPNILSGPEKATPLMIAAGAGNVMVISMLLDAGADLDAVDKVGDSVLSYAVKNGRKYAIDALVEAGAPYAVADKSGKSLSEIARSAGYSHIARDLDERVAGMKDEVGQLRIDMLDEARSGNYDKAADISLRLYDLTRGAYGEKDERTLAALNDMARTSMKAGRYDEAGEYYQKLYDNTRDVYGPSSEKTAVAANNLGVYYYSRSNFRKALEYFSEAYKIASNLTGESSEMTRKFHSNMLMARDGADNSAGAVKSLPSADSGDGGTSTGEFSEYGSTVNPRFSGDGGASDVLGVLGLDGGDGEERLFGIIEWALVFVSVLALAYFIYRLMDSLSDSSDKVRALTKFEARMSLSLGRLSEKFDNYNAAARHYEKGLKIMKDDVHSRYRLAKIYHHKLSNAPMAKRHYRILIQSLPPEHAFRKEAMEAIKSINTVKEPSRSLF